MTEVFDHDRINKQIEVVKTYKIGNFVWEDETHAKATFVEDPNGMYFVTPKGVVGRTLNERIVRLDMNTVPHPATIKDL